MRISLLTIRAITRRHEKWHGWFAWYPVLVGEEYVWLERLWRCRQAHLEAEYWEYTPIAVRNGH